MDTTGKEQVFYSYEGKIDPPLPTDLADLNRKNQICKAERFYNDVKDTKETLLQEIRSLNIGICSLEDLGFYLERYIVTLERGEALPWFPSMNLLLTAMDGIKDLEADVRNRIEGKLIGEFLKEENKVRTGVGNDEE